MDTLKMGSDKKNVTPPLDTIGTKCYTNIVREMRERVLINRHKNKSTNVLE